MLTFRKETTKCVLIIMRKSIWASATALLCSLHWLPVKARIEYKIASLCHQCLNNNRMPSYLSELISPYVPQRDLRSVDSSLLAVPRFSLQTCGMKASSSFGPKEWNLLPLKLRQTACYDTFKKNLKTHYFNTLEISLFYRLFLILVWFSDFVIPKLLVSLCTFLFLCSRSALSLHHVC